MITIDQRPERKRSWVMGRDPRGRIQQIDYYRGSVESTRLRSVIFYRLSHWVKDRMRRSLGRSSHRDKVHSRHRRNLDGESEELLTSNHDHVRGNYPCCQDFRTMELGMLLKFPKNMSRMGAVYPVHLLVWEVPMNTCTQSPESKHIIHD